MESLFTSYNLLKNNKKLMNDFILELDLKKFRSILSAK